MYTYIEKYRYKDICFKKLAYVITEAGKSKIYRVGHQTRDPGRLLKFIGTLLQNSHLLGGDCILFQSDIHLTG